jgi:hypothetical protein
MAAPRTYPLELRERRCGCGALSSRAGRSPTSPVSLACTLSSKAYALGECPDLNVARGPSLTG